MMESVIKKFQGELD